MTPAAASVATMAALLGLSLAVTMATDERRRRANPGLVELLVSAVLMLAWGGVRAVAPAGLVATELATHLASVTCMLTLTVGVARVYGQPAWIGRRLAVGGLGGLSILVASGWGGPGHSLVVMETFGFLLTVELPWLIWTGARQRGLSAPIVLLVTTVVLTVSFAGSAVVAALFALGPGAHVPLMNSHTALIGAIVMATGFTNLGAYVALGELAGRRARQNAGLAERLFHALERCPSCKRVHVRGEQWLHLHELLAEDLGGDVTHTICRACEDAIGAEEDELFENLGEDASSGQP